MTKTTSETKKTIGEKKNGKKNKKILEKNIKIALESASILMKDVMSSSSPKRMTFCLDLKRKLEEIEKEYGINLI